MRLRSTTTPTIRRPSASGRRRPETSAWCWSTSFRLDRQDGQDSPGRTKLNLNGPVGVTAVANRGRESAESLLRDDLRRGNHVPFHGARDYHGLAGVFGQGWVLLVLESVHLAVGREDVLGAGLDAGVGARAIREIRVVFLHRFVVFPAFAVADHSGPALVGRES